MSQNTYVILNGEVLENGGTPSVIVSGPAPSPGEVIIAQSATTAAWGDPSSGTITLSGDVTGSSSSNTVSKIQGVVISGTPSAGYVLEATSYTAASWQAAPTGFSAGGDLSGSSTSQQVVSIAGSSGTVDINCASLLQGMTLNDGYKGAITLDATTTTIYTEPAEAASTTYDYVVTVVGQETSDGDLYRADFAFNYQRIGSAAPTVAGASPVPLNVRTTGDGSNWSAAISTSSNSVIVQVTGQVSKTVRWSVSFNRVTC